MTNIDKIKSMTVEELATFLCNLMCNECCKDRCPGNKFCGRKHNGLIDWLGRDEEQDVEPWMEAVAEIREGDRL